MNAYVARVLRHRIAVIVATLLVTAVMSWFAVGLKIVIDPVTMAPQQHPYGLATKRIDAKKTAFFIDGDNNIIFAPEGGLVKKKYRLIRIGDKAVMMENVDSKKQQSVPLAEDAGANMSN